MDIEQTLTDIRALYKKQCPTEDDMVELAIKIQALDEWLTRGNYLPSDWVPPEWK